MSGHKNRRQEYKKRIDKSEKKSVDIFKWLKNKNDNLTKNNYVKREILEIRKLKKEIIKLEKEIKKLKF